MKRAAWFSVSLTAILLGCAHQMVPSGGPDDTTPPTVIAATPASGSVGVETNSRVVITFSEWISPAFAPKSVSILPPPEGGVRVNASGKKLVIDPVRGFADSATYHVVVTSSLQDLHQNALAAPLTIVFSTGSSLDSGVISGCIIDPSKSGDPDFRPTVALFRERGEATDSMLFATPDYLAQADSSGFFSFSFLRPDNYRMIAFVDKNNLRRLTPGTEAVYSPLRKTIAVGTAGDTVRLYQSACDTTTPGITAVRTYGATTLGCVWSAPVDTLFGYSDPAFSLVRHDDTVAAVPDVEEVFWTGGRTHALLRLADPMERVPYGLIAVFRKTRGSFSEVVADTVRFNGIDLRDSVPPALTASPRPPADPLRPKLSLTFSEPVRLVSALSLADSMGDTIPLMSEEGYADTVVLEAKRRLRPGEAYRLLLMKGDAEDLAGNGLAPRDSTDTAAVLRFSTPPSDSLAISLTGCVSCLAPDTNRVWRFLPLDGGYGVESDDIDGCFRFDTLAAGKGRIGYFVDVNRNGRRDRGRLLPFVSPEPYDVLPDTVEARARWEVEGIEIDECDGCGSP